MAVIGVKSITGITSITNAAGADVLTFHSNNTTERLRITSAGEVGIGTNTPIGGLHLNKNGNNGISFRMENYEGYSSFHNDGGALHIDSGQHIFRNEDGSSERLRITSAGKVAIGNDSPQQLLHVWPDTTNASTAAVRVTAGDRGATTGINTLRIAINFRTPL